MSVSIEEQVGDTSPHMFTTGQAVLLTDLRPMPASKWRLAIISGKLGPFRAVGTVAAIAAMAATLFSNL